MSMVPVVGGGTTWLMLMAVRRFEKLIVELPRLDKEKCSKTNKHGAVDSFRVKVLLGAASARVGRK